MESETIEIGNLLPELIESIFSRIPLKPLVRLKCVSKTWCSFINLFRICHPLTTSSGLIVIRLRTDQNQELEELTFIKLQDKIQGQGAAFNNTHQASVMIRRNPQYCQLIDSCNGMLLYATNDDDFWTYYVFSPFLNQALALPPAHEVARLACAGLAFDGPRNSTFRVILFFLREFNSFAGTMQFKIFSSETWQWRELEAIIFNSHILLEEGFDPEQCFHPSVFWRDKLYWIWSFCMLLFDIKNQFFKLIPLPLTGAQCRKSASDVHPQLLWESDGHLYFCHVLDGISIFTYIGDHHLNHDKCIDDYGRYWQFNQFVRLKDLTSDNKVECIINGTVRKLIVKCKIRPCAFNQDLQLMYLFVPPGRIFSYSFETQELVQVWSCLELGTNYPIRRIFPFLFKSVNLFSLSRNMPRV